MGELFGGTIQGIAESVQSHVALPAEPGATMGALAAAWSDLSTSFQFQAGQILAADLANLNPLQKISLFLGMMILVYTVVRMGLKRRAALASGQPSPRPHAGDVARRSLQSSTLGGPGRSLYDVTDDEDRPRATGTRGLSALQGGAELESLVVNLREVGREIEARLDTKIRFAQRLLEEAEITLTNLEVARARAENTARDPHAAHRANLAAAETSLAEADRVVPIAEEERANTTKPKSQSKPESFFGPASEDEPEDIPVTPTSKKATAETQADALEDLKSRGVQGEGGGESTPETSSQRRVRELAAEGKSAREIAAEVERPVGEIELILALGRGGDSVKSP